MDQSQYQEPTHESLYGTADQNSAQAAAARKQGMKDIMIGLLFLIVGLAITFITYRMAQDGGRYVVTWGLVVFGLIQAGKGVFTYMRAGK